MLKLLIQAFFFSVVLHIIYIITMLTIGFTKSKGYGPDIDSTWNNAGRLPNNVSIGTAPSPYWYMFSMLIGTVFCALIIAVVNKKRTLLKKL